MKIKKTNKGHLNSFLSPMWAVATSVLVTEVPIFAPITMGIASLNSIRFFKIENI